MRPGSVNLNAPRGFSRRAEASGVYLITWAGFPVTTAYGGTSRVTTAPAPTIACWPIVQFGKMVAFAPIEAPRSTTVRLGSVRWALDRGKGSFENVAFGPTNTSSPSCTPSHSCTPLFMVTRSPITTSFSMNTWSQILQSSPIRAPARTCANAQIRDPRPTASESQAPSGVGSPDTHAWRGSWRMWRRQGRGAGRSPDTAAGRGQRHDPPLRAKPS